MTADPEGRPTRSGSTHGTARPGPELRAGLRAGTRRCGRLLLETMLMLFPLAPYELLATASARRAGDAGRHAEALQAMERQAHIAVEPHLHRAAAAHPTLMTLALHYYGVMHFAVTAGAALLLTLCARARWAATRTAFLVSSLVGVTVFWLYPVAPPNLLPGTGFGGAATSHPGNPFGAMPSLHVAWALWAAAALVVAAGATGGRARTAALAAGGLHVAITVLVVLVTGHHWLVDVIGGLVVAGLGAAAGAAHRLGRWWGAAPVPAQRASS
jgi:hypothetical protein